MTFLYFLPKRHFFKKGYTGSVIHALGIIEGCEKAGIGIKVIANNHIANYPYQEILSRYLWGFSNSRQKYIQLFKLFRTLRDMGKNTTNEHKILIRYSFSEVIYLIILALISRFCGITAILEVNTLFSFYGHKPRIPFLENIELNICKLFATIYVVSPTTQFYFITKGFERVVFIPNGINHDNVPLLPVLEFKPRVVKYFGSVKHYYNIQMPIEALEGTEYRFEIYGNIPVPFQNRYKNHKQVIFKGKYSNEDIYSMVNPEEDILILPYKANTIAEYGFPTKLGEYLALGCLILTTDTGVLKSIFTHGKNAIVYSDGNTASFREALNSIEGLTVADVNKIRFKAYAELEHYQWKDLVRDIYDERSHSK